MARSMTRREKTLLIVLAIAGFGFLYYDREQVGANVRNARDDADMTIVGQYPEVLMSMLEPVIADYDPNGRNLFNYYTPPPPKRKVGNSTRTQPIDTKPVVPVIVPDRPVVKPVAKNQKPIAPNMGFDYLGYLGPKDNKIAVFAEGEELLLARIGDVVQQQFRLVDFGYETVLMGYTDETFKDQTKELAQVGR